MKKIKSILALTLLFLALGCGSAMASDWTIEVNGQPIDAEVKIIEGRSLIPLRAVGEALGLEVAWDGEKQSVYLICTVNNIENAVVLHVPTATADIGIQGNSKSTENNVNKYLYHEEGFKLEVPPSNIDGRVYVPVRFVCNLFGSPLHVDGNNIKIGDIFTAEKRGDIEGLRKKEVVVLKNISKEECEIFTRDSFNAVDEYLDAWGTAISYCKNPTNDDWAEIFLTKVKGDLTDSEKVFRELYLTAQQYNETQSVCEELSRLIEVLGKLKTIDETDRENAPTTAKNVMNSLTNASDDASLFLDKLVELNEKVK